MPTIKNPGAGQGYIFYDMEHTQETGIHFPNYIFTWRYPWMTLQLKKGQKRKWKENGCLKGTHLVHFIQLFIDTEFRAMLS